jgi:6-phosphofructokinase
VIALVAHRGGPTAVINASLLGIVEEARRHAGVTSLLGARFGIEGVLAEDFIDLFAVEPRVLSAVGRAPASALGSSRRPVTPADIERVLFVCRARGIRVLFYTGGNGSMTTAQQIAALARDAGQPLAVIASRKTIDNDWPRRTTRPVTRRPPDSSRARRGIWRRQPCASVAGAVLEVLAGTPAGSRRPPRSFDAMWMMHLI